MEEQVKEQQGAGGTVEDPGTEQYFDRVPSPSSPEAELIAAIQILDLESVTQLIENGASAKTRFFILPAGQRYGTPQDVFPGLVALVSEPSGATKTIPATMIQQSPMLQAIETIHGLFSNPIFGCSEDQKLRMFGILEQLYIGGWRPGEEISFYVVDKVICRGALRPLYMTAIEIAFARRLPTVFIKFFLDRGSDPLPFYNQARIIYNKHINLADYYQEILALCDERFEAESEDVDAPGKS